MKQEPTRTGAFGLPPVQVSGALGTDTRHLPWNSSHSVNEYSKSFYIHHNFFRVVGAVVNDQIRVK